MTDREFEELENARGLGYDEIFEEINNSRQIKDGEFRELEINHHHKSGKTNFSINNLLACAAAFIFSGVLIVCGVSIVNDLRRVEVPGEIYYDVLG